jgi:hypothetical protein
MSPINPAPMLVSSSDGLQCFPQVGDYVMAREPGITRVVLRMYLEKPTATTLAGWGRGPSCIASGPELLRGGRRLGPIQDIDIGPLFTAVKVPLPNIHPELSGWVNVWRRYSNHSWYGANFAMVWRYA